MLRSTPECQSRRHYGRKSCAGSETLTIMADRMLQDFEGDRITVSYQGELAVLRRQENCFLLYYGKEATDIPKQQWVAIFHGSEKLNKYATLLTLSST